MSNSVVRLVRGADGFSDLVDALRDLRERVMSVCPGIAEVEIVFRPDDRLKVVIRVESIQERDVILMSLGRGMVAGWSFDHVTHSLEHATRGRHCVCGVAYPA